MMPSQRITARVREALAAMKEASKAEIAERLGVQTREDLKRVAMAVDGLVKSGEAVPLTVDPQGEPYPPFYELTYHWVARLVKDRGEVQRKLWKFACHRAQKGEPFTAGEAAGLASCDRDYAKRYYRWLWAAGYLAIAGRGRAGVILYRVVAGKEREPALAWNRRAERRKNSDQGSVDSGQKEIPPNPPFPKGGEVAPAAEPATPKERLKAVLENFGQALVEIAGGHGRAAEIVQQMKDTILAVKEQGHGEPTEGHH